MKLLRPKIQKMLSDFELSINKYYLQDLLNLVSSIITSISISIKEFLIEIENKLQSKHQLIQDLVPKSYLDMFS